MGRLAWIFVAAALATACESGPDLPAAWAELEPGLEAVEASGCEAGVEVERLSEHPCFEGSPPRPLGGLVPFGVRAELWSDGLDKDRYVYLPPGEPATVGASGVLRVPPGTVVIKEFRDGARWIETRVLARVGEDTWNATTYVWTEDGSDATRDDEGARVTLDDGGEWPVPSAEECFECHAGSDVLIGLRVDQLNQDWPYALADANQLATLAHLGWLDVTDLDAPDALPSLATPEDDDATLDERARAYLFGNCAHCHQPGGTGGSNLDLRAIVPLSLTGACDQTPERGDPWDGEGALLTPGRADRSVIHYRVASSDDSWRMPSLGTERVDEAAASLLADWIDGLTGCE